MWRKNLAKIKNYPFAVFLRIKGIKVNLFTIAKIKQLKVK